MGAGGCGRRSEAVRSVSIPARRRARRCTDSGRNERKVRSKAIRSNVFCWKSRPDEQEEHEAGERIHEPLAAPGGDVDEAAAEEHREPEGQRDLEGHDARSHGAPGDAEVVRGAEEQHRQREEDVQDVEQPLKAALERAAVGIARDAEEHDVAEGESGDAELQVEPPNRRRPREPAVFGGDRRLVAERGDGFRHAPKRRLTRSILDVHRASEQVNLGPHDARLEAPELLEQPHARRAMNGRNRQGHPRPAAIIEGDEPRRDRRVVEAREAAGIERRGGLLRDARRIIEAVEAVEPVRRQDREDALAAAATERPASRHDGGGAALVAAVATERLRIDRCDDGRGDSHGAVPAEGAREVPEGKCAFG